MSAEDYTPDTEHVRHDYAYDGYLEAPLVQLEDQFDRWFAAEIRRAKADALREFADSIMSGRAVDPMSIKKQIYKRANKVEESEV